MYIVFAGKGKALVQIILFALKVIDKNKIYVLPVKNDDGRTDWQVSVRKVALLFGLPIISLEEAKVLENSVFLSVQFDKILKPNEFKTDRLFNIHFSYLPFYKGVYPTIWPILNQEDFSGVTLHNIDSGIDTGNIIDQRKIFLHDQINSFDLYQECCERALNIFKENYEKLFFEVDYINSKQPKQFGSYFSKRSLNLSDFSIDFRKTASEISSQFRGLMFKPYQMPKLKNYDIGKVEILNCRDYQNVGKVLDEDSESFIIASIDYTVKAFKDYSKEIFGVLENGISTKDFLKLIKGKNKNSKICNHLGWTPLMVAAYQGNLELVKELVQLGFSVNETNFKGTNVLMYAKSFASKSGDLNIVKYLIDNGAEVDQKDDYGLNALHYAIKENNKLVVGFLKDVMLNDTDTLS